MNISIAYSTQLNSNIRVRKIVSNFFSIRQVALNLIKFAQLLFESFIVPEPKKRKGIHWSASLNVASVGPLSSPPDAGSAITY